MRPGAPSRRPEIEAVERCVRTLGCRCANAEIVRFIIPNLRLQRELHTGAWNSGWR